MVERRFATVYNDEDIDEIHRRYGMVVLPFIPGGRHRALMNDKVAALPGLVAFLDASEGASCRAALLRAAADACPPSQFRSATRTGVGGPREASAYCLTLGHMFGRAASPRRESECRRV